VVIGQQLVLDCSFKSDHEPFTTTFFYKTAVLTTLPEFLQMDKAGNLTDEKVGRVGFLSSISATVLSSMAMMR